MVFLVLYYTISCVEQRVVSFATRSEVLAFMRSSAKERGIKAVSKRVKYDILQDDSHALSFFLSKMARKGLTVRDVSSDVLVFEGERGVREFLRRPTRPTPTVLERPTGKKKS